MAINMLTPMNCPSCGEYDRCYEPGCICPTCSPSPNENLNQALIAWRLYAPMMKALDDEEVSWGWSRVERRDGYKYSIEAECNEIYFEITHASHGFILDVNQMLSKGNYDNAPEYEWRTIHDSTDAADIAQTIRAWAVAL